MPVIRHLSWDEYQTAHPNEVTELVRVEAWRKRLVAAGYRVIEEAHVLERSPRPSGGVR